MEHEGIASPVWVERTQGSIGDPTGEEQGGEQGGEEGWNSRF